MYSVKISTNQGPDFESEITSTFPKGFVCLRSKTTEPSLEQLKGITEFLLDNISLLMVFSATIGFKKFLEAFASEAGKALATKLFKPVTEDSKQKKLSEFKNEHGLSFEQEVPYKPLFELDVVIEETRERYSITVSNKRSFESSEALRQEMLRLLKYEIERVER